MKTLNFNNVNKKYLTVKLNDDENTTILVQSPTKKIMDSLIAMEKETTDNDIENIDTLYKVCTEIMNRNVARIKITKEYLEEVFDIEDIMIFFSAYTEFIGLQTKGKN